MQSLFVQLSFPSKKHPDKYAPQVVFDVYVTEAKLYVFAYPHVVLATHAVVASVTVFN